MVSIGHKRGRGGEQYECHAVRRVREPVWGRALYTASVDGSVTVHAVRCLRENLHHPSGQQRRAVFYHIFQDFAGR